MVSVPWVPFSTDDTKLKGPDDIQYEWQVILVLGKRLNHSQSYPLTLKAAAFPKCKCGGKPCIQLSLGRWTRNGLLTVFDEIMGETASQLFPTHLLIFPQGRGNHRAFCQESGQTMAYPSCRVIWTCARLSACQAVELFPCALPVPSLVFFSYN